MSQETTSIKINASLVLFIGSLILFFAGFYVAKIIDLNNPSTQGIGGFVYQEIQWQDQTIKVMRENCGSGLYVERVDGNPNKLRLMCWKEVCKSAAEGEWCKKEYWRSPIITPKE